MNLGSLKPQAGARRPRKRIGRGDSSGHGGTAGRGHKGQLSRSGAKRRAWFEGGQMPLQRRVPKRGFTNINREENQVVNLGSLMILPDSIQEITPDILLQYRLIRNISIPVKILADGDLTRAFDFVGVNVSRTALEKIEAAKGSVKTL
ncbi:MAG: 50S ribosomal protein L15 [Candidatus Delongbacteria bacterium]|nr:50S ribosomal protein L15 [Candidatus Delongbacteria bacterium]